MNGKWIPMRAIGEPATAYSLAYAWGEHIGTLYPKEAFETQQARLAHLHTLIYTNTEAQTEFTIGPLVVKFKHGMADIYFDTEAPRANGVVYDRCEIDAPVLELKLLETVDKWLQDSTTKKYTAKPAAPKHKLPEHKTLKGKKKQR